MTPQPFLPTTSASPATGAPSAAGRDRARPRAHTIIEHVRMVEESLAGRPHWTRGTAHLNVLETTAPDIAAIVRGSSLDPSLYPLGEPEFIRWLGNLLDTSTGQRMVARAAA